MPRSTWHNARGEAEGVTHLVQEANGSRTTAGRLAPFLARVVLPRMDWVDEQEWQQLLGWHREMRSLGPFATLALPCVSLPRPGEADGAASSRPG